MEIDPKTGLPVQAIAWEDLAKKGQNIKVSTEKKRYGKISTIISGFDKETDMKKTAKELKNKFACGGTIKGDTIELQGNHKAKIKKALVEIGFDEKDIEN